MWQNSQSRFFWAGFFWVSAAAWAFSEHLQNTALIGIDRVNPILAFRVKSTPTGFGAFTVEVNTKPILTVTQGHPMHYSGGFWEVFDAKILNPGINNTVEFRAVKKKWWFSDVVLWFQVTV